MPNILRSPKQPPRLGDLFFGVLVLLHLFPVWAFRFIPTQDGPSHLGTANSIRLLSRPEGELFRNYFSIDRGPVPYWTVNLLLERLLDAVPPLTAEKILVTSYIVLFAFSVRYFVSSVDRRQAYLSWLAFPLMMGFWFHMGFYNFCIGVALYCWIAGLWLRQQERVTSGGLMALGALSIALYFTHPFPAAVLVLTIGLLSVWMIVREKAGRRCLMTLAPFAPFLVLLGTFCKSMLDRAGGKVDPPLALSDAWGIFLDLQTLASFPATQVPILGAVALVLALLLAAAIRKKTGRGLRGLERGDGYLAVLAVLFVLYLSVPSWQMMNRRLIVFIALALIAWLATVPLGGRAAAGVRIAAFVLAAAWAVDLTVQYRKWNAALEEAASLSEDIPPGGTLFYLWYAFPWQEDGIRFNPYRHFGDYVSAERDLVSLNNYEACNRFLPLQYNRALNPYLKIGNPEWARKLDLLGYSKSGGSIDHILMWVARPENLSAQAEARLRPQLEEGFDLVGTSVNRRAFLYRRKGFV